MRASATAGAATCRPRTTQQHGEESAIVRLVFIAGFGFGFMYHHVASFATSEHALDSATRLRSVEARLAQIEARFGAHAADHVAAITDGYDGAVVVDDGPVKKSKARRRYEKASQKALPHPGAAAAKTAAAANHDIPGCPSGRKPYHVVLTAQDSTYQAWQTRIMVHHLQKHMRGNKCTEITGFTRLLSSNSGNHDELSKEIPTVTAKQLDGGSACQNTDQNTCDMGFPVMNRPHAITQLLANWPKQITEEYILIAETDHIFMQVSKRRHSNTHHTFTHPSLPSSHHLLTTTPTTTTSSCRSRQTARHQQRQPASHLVI